LLRGHPGLQAPELVSGEGGEGLEVDLQISLGVAHPGQDGGHIPEFRADPADVVVDPLQVACDRLQQPAGLLEEQIVAVLDSGGEDGTDLEERGRIERRAVLGGVVESGDILLSGTDVAEELTSPSADGRWVLVAELPEELRVHFHDADDGFAKRPELVGG
jgi:hypothetical protein